MRISELMSRLSNIREKEGDISVFIQWPNGRYELDADEIVTETLAVYDPPPGLEYWEASREVYEEIVRGVVLG